MALKTLSIAKLQDLKAKVDIAIAQKVSERRHELEGELSKLAHLEGRARGKVGRGGSRGAVTPKYRNPDDPSQTWAGRGLRPRWLVALESEGKDRKDYAV